MHKIVRKLVYLSRENILVSESFAFTIEVSNLKAYRDYNSSRDSCADCKFVILLLYMYLSEEILKSRKYEFYSTFPSSYYVSIFSQSRIY